MFCVGKYSDYVVGVNCKKKMTGGYVIARRVQLLNPLSVLNYGDNEPAAESLISKLIVLFQKQISCFQVGRKEHLRVYDGLQDFFKSTI